MGRRVGAVLIVILTLFAAAVFLTWAVRLRVESSRVGCANNLREQSRFAADHGRPGGAADIPPGTVVNPGLPPDRRLSWAADALPRLDQRRLPADLSAAGLDRTGPWDAEANQRSARTRLAVFVCPANPPDQLGATQYLGLSGLDPGGAALGLGPPVPASAGCFRYDSPTPFAAVSDGLSSTLLFGETNRNLGLWLEGGPATVRGLDPAGPAGIGTGGQFGGNHPGVGNFAAADGSLRVLSEATDPGVLRALVTIAGGPGTEVIGE